VELKKEGYLWDRDWMVGRGWRENSCINKKSERQEVGDLRFSFGYGWGNEKETLQVKQEENWRDWDFQEWGLAGEGEKKRG